MNRRFRLSTPLAGIILSGLCVAAFWPVFFQGFHVYDDSSYVTENPVVLEGLTPGGVIWAFTTFTEANWHPLTWLSHMTDVEFFGLDPGPQHAVNVLLQALAAVFLYVALVRLTKSAWQSLFVAAVFAVHPLQVESVAWIAERKDVLSSMLGMLAFLAYARYAERPEKSRLGAVFAVLLVGLLAKPSLVVLPLLFLLLDFWPLQRTGAGATWRRLAVEKLPLLGLALISGIVTLIAQREGGAMEYASELNLQTRLGNAVVSFARYVGKSFWPVDLAVIYPHPGTVPPVVQLVGALVLLAGISAAVLRWRREAPYLVTGWFWFIIALLPVIGITQVGLQAMADRYMRLPLIGLSLAVAWGVPEVARRVKLSRKTLSLAGASLVCVLSVVTFMQAGYWENSVTLFRHALDVTEGNWIAHNNLGVALKNSGRALEATQHFHEALQVRPGFTEASLNMAAGLLAEDRPDSAAAILRRAVARNPRDGDLRLNLGTALVRMGKPEEALAEYAVAFERDTSRGEILEEMIRVAADAGMLARAESLALGVIERNPGSSRAHDLLGTVYAQGGDEEKAVSAFRQAITLDAGNATALYNLGRIYDRRGHQDSALVYLEASVRMDPEFFDAHRTLGALHARKGDVQEAVKHFSEAVRIKPDFVEGHTSLGRLLELEGQNDSALAHFSRALPLDREGFQVHYYMGMLLARMGSYEEAETHLRTALERNPDLGEARDVLRQLEARGAQ